MAQLLLPFGIDPTQVPLDLEYQLSDADRALARTRLGPTDRPLRLAVNISASSRSRYWGRENFIACLRWMRDFDPRFAIWVGGAPAYRTEVEAIAAVSGAACMPAVTSFHEVAALFREFDLLLTPDTSVVHLAAAWKTPMVGLFPETPDLLPWHPYHSPYRLLYAPSVPRIPVVAVEEALRSLVEERFPGGAAG
jgi:ADP-heptose:LPS heptosyltransferase